MFAYTFEYSPAMEEERVTKITNKLHGILAEENLTLEQGEFILEKAKENINLSARISKPVNF
ncbi:hypothetical protein ACYRFT_01360 [Listeria kieliensis]